MRYTTAFLAVDVQSRRVSSSSLGPPQLGALYFSSLFSSDMLTPPFSMDLPQILKNVLSCELIVAE